MKENNQITYTKPPLSNGLMWVIWLFLGWAGIIRIILHRKFGWTMFLIGVIFMFTIIGPIITELWNIRDAFYLNSWLNKGVVHTPKERQAEAKLKEYDKNPSHVVAANKKTDSIKPSKYDKRLDAIEKKLAQFGFTGGDMALWVRREVRQLPRLLDNDEKIVDAMWCMTNAHIMSGSNQNMVAILTPSRILFLNSGMFVSDNSSSISLDQISGVSVSGRFVGTLEIDTSGEKIGVSANKQICQRFAQAVKKYSYKYKRNLYGGNSQPQEDDADKLIKMKKLLSAKIISKDDFEKYKDKLLK